jgi:hypothetical protein
MSRNIRKTGVINLVVGIVLLLLGITAMISISPNISTANLTGQLGFILLFVFVGGYEIGKYAEKYYTHRITC